jgi:hypothetical protein
LEKQYGVKVNEKQNSKHNKKQKQSNKNKSKQAKQDNKQPKPYLTTSIKQKLVNLQTKLIGKAIWSCSADKFSNFEEMIEKYQKRGLPDSTEKLGEPCERPDENNQQSNNNETKNP